MPRLLYFVACSKAITSQEDNSLSLIALLEGIEITVVPGADPDESTKVPISWVAMVQWMRLLDDADREFEIRLQLIQPDGRIALEGTNVFSMEKQPMLRTPFNVAGFPVSQAGVSELHLSIREPAVAGDWVEVATYPIEIAHNRPEPSDDHSEDIDDNTSEN